MPITIGSNIASLQAQRQLGKATDENSKVLERLSSGLRINSASDDAAGLAVSSSLKADTRIYTQAIRNVSDGVSVLNIAQGALDSLTNIVIRQKELAEQSANGVYSDKQRKALQTESDALTNEYNRVTQTTKFNGINLFDLSSGTINLQIGYGQGSVLSVNTVSDLSRAVGSGTFTQTGTSPVSQFAATSADLNGDGIADLIQSTGLFTSYLGNGDGTFKLVQNQFTGVTSTNQILGDINGDGKLDYISGDNTGHLSVYTGNGDGTFALQNYISGVSNSSTIGGTIGDYNGDGKMDFTYIDSDNVSLRLFTQQANGSFTSQNVITGLNSSRPATTGDFNNDGKLDILASTGSSITFFSGNGDGSFRAGIDTSATFGSAYKIQVTDFNRDGKADLLTEMGGGATVLLGNGDGSFRISQQIGTSPANTEGGADFADLNDDGFLDVAVYGDTNHKLTVALGNGDGTFSISQQTTAITPASTARDLVLLDSNQDGIAEIFLNGIQLTQGTTQSITVPYLDLSSQSGSRKALTRTSQMLDSISKQLGTIGSYQSRLSIAAANTRTTIIEYGSAASRITDADIAQESAALIQTSIVQKAAASVLAQANQQPQLALSLLRG